MRIHDKEAEREGYRYYAQQLKLNLPGFHMANPYPSGSDKFVSWQDGFDLAAYDDLIGDLKDEL